MPSSRKPKAARRAVAPASRPEAPPAARQAVRTPAGEVRGVARGLDPGGGLVLGLESGAEITVTAGDVEWTPSETP